MTLEALILCLALNIYFEANTEPLKGQYAVAHVTMNRVEEKYADNVCKVVYQPNQFSWTKNKPKRPTNQALAQSKEIAVIVLSGLSKDPTYGATHYHNQTVKPKWRFRETVKIANHTFYKKRT